MIIRVAGIDPSLRNTGLCKGTFDTATNTLQVTRLKLVQTEKQSGKQVRVNSDDLRCGNEIIRAMHDWIADAHIVFAEIPSGGQSAAAAKGLGIATGILASIAGIGQFKGQLIQVMPAEVKLAAIGSKNASKDEMIEWANGRWPEAEGWLRARGKADGPLVNANEHLADACGAINAGIQTDQFRNLVQALAVLSTDL